MVGEMVGAEGSSAIGDAGQAAISFTFVIDGTPRFASLKAPDLKVCI